MMKAARLMMLLLLMDTGVSGAAIDCSSLQNSQTLLFNVTISWTYNSTSQTCTAHKLEPGVVAAPLITLFAKDETKTIETVGNECLKFTCVHPRLVLNIQNSSCQSEKGCSLSFKRSQPGCTTHQQCGCLASGYYYGPSSNKDVLACQLIVFTQIPCVPAHWPGYPVLHPAHWPGYPVLHPAHWPAYPVYQPAQWPAYPVYHPALGSAYPAYHPGWSWGPLVGAGHLPALVHPATGGGFHWGGPFHWIPNHVGAFPWLPASGGGFLPAPTPSGSGSMGTPDPKDCGRGGMFFKGRENSTCATFICVEDSSTSPPGYYFQIQREGCYYNGSCYRNGTIVEHVDGHKTVTCHLDSATGQYHLGDECKGCYVNDKCLPVGHTDMSLECKHFTCKKNEEDKFEYEVEYKGCYEPYNDTCMIDDQETFHPKGDCSFSRCEARHSGKWNVQYKTTSHCSIPNQTCETTEVPSGCLHDGKCYPVKTVLTKSKCTQFVCYSDGVDSPPSWLPRATGCYGPRGCMEFGEEYVDISTGNTYRCNYAFGGLGHKFPEFHEGCVFLDGTPVALGQSILREGVYYGCSHNRVFMSVPLNQMVPPEKNCTPCGLNPETGENVYLSLPYYFKHAICEWKENCTETNCTYFDKRCYGGSESPNETRSLGDKFMLDGLECVCTQDEHVYNYLSKENPEFNAPSLCAEKGVREGACKDADSTVRKWGELWVLPDAKPLQICTCHPENRKVFCSLNMPDVINLSSERQH